MCCASAISVWLMEILSIQHVFQASTRASKTVSNGYVNVIILRCMYSKIKSRVLGVQVNKYLYDIYISIDLVAH